MEWILIGLIAFAILLYNLDTINIRISFWKRKPKEKLVKTIDVRRFKKPAEK